MKFIIIQVFLVSIKCFITSDSGQSNYFEYSNGFNCSNLSTTTDINQFSGTFESPPQVFVALIRTTLYSLPETFVRIEIVSVTTEYFQAQIFCSPGSSLRHYYQWYAVNDNRITILHPPMQTNLVDGSIFTHTHNLIKATKAIVVVDSLKFLGRPINFQLNVYQVTSTDVQIKLHNVPPKLSELGYYIVVGTQEAFQLGNQVSTTGTTYSASIPLLNLGMLFLPIIGIHYDYNDAIRIIIQSWPSLSNFEYSVGTCKSINYTLDSNSYMHSIRFQEVYFFKQILFPMYIYSYRVTKKYERYISNAIKIQILELNQQFVSFGDYNVQIPEQMNKITIQIELKFMPNERLVGQFLKCNECGTKNVYKIDQNYLCANNFIRYRLLLRQYSIYTQDLIISIGLSTVNIKQIINQVVKEYEIVQLQFINQQL